MGTSVPDNPDRADPASGNDSPHYEIRQAGPDDGDAIRSLFARAFPDEMPESLWRWKYNRPQSRAIVVYRDGELVAHFGGVGMAMLMAGKPQTAVQITDLMVDPKARHAVRRKSPFYLSAKTFLDTYAGFEKPFYLVYGFPSARAMVLLEKLALARTVDQMVEVQWSLDSGTANPAPKRLIPLDATNFAQYAGTIDELWERFSRQFGDRFICQKDASYFQWRYLEHPVKKYSLYLQKAGLLGRVARLIVLRHDGNKSMLMDVLEPAMDLSAAITTASALARQENKKQLVTWCTETFKPVFAIHAAKCETLPLAIPANTCSPAHPWSEQVGKWWLMPGDTDYQ